MPRFEVRLYTEQEAILSVFAPEGASEKQLRDLALEALDRSGGAEWETTYGKTTWKLATS